MATRVSLTRARQHYEPDIKVFTAASEVDHLSALYLGIHGEDGFRGLGEVRANIEFLSDIAEEDVPATIRKLVESIQWSKGPELILNTLSSTATNHPSMARAALESALLDGIAKRDGVPVVEVLGGEWAGPMATNQCLFWGPNALFDRLAERYVAEGFCEIKVRIAVGSFAEDLQRLQRLRERFSDDIEIAVDANGAWSAEEAVERLRQLRPLGIAYVEQPTPPGDWDAFRRAGEDGGVAIMMDEGLKTDADVERLAALGPPFLAHLKIVKMGGPRAVVEAAKHLRDAGVECMVGQMNEGAMATALAVHCAMAVNPRFSELYGCYGLIDDPASGLSYHDGCAVVGDQPGLGIRFDETKTTPIWEVTG